MVAMTAIPFRQRPAIRFTLHFAEMIVAMVVGMVALGPLWSWAAPGLAGRADAAAIIMATDMTIGMTAWMAVRRHSWARIAEMAAAMYLPFVLFLVPYYLGWVSGTAVMTGGHILMIALMLAAMLWRYNDYAHHGHHGHH